MKSHAIRVLYVAIILVLGSTSARSVFSFHGDLAWSPGVTGSSDMAIPMPFTARPATASAQSSSSLLKLNFPGLKKPYSLVNEAGHVVQTITASNYFHPTLIAAGPVDVPSGLAGVATDTLRYLNQYPDDKRVSHAGPLARLGVTSADMERTLAFVARIEAEDQKKKVKKHRLSDPDFLAKHFVALRWMAGGRSPGQLRLTKYAVFHVDGRSSKQGAFRCALYAVPDDEDPDRESTTKSSPMRMRFTKQDVIAGVYEGGGKASGRARPLVWLTRDGLEEALMQGTAVVHFKGGKERIYNVYRNNGIPFDSKIANARLQRRYWYFREVEAILGYGEGGRSKVKLEPRAAFAGDVFNLGLGLLIAVQTGTKLHLGILADRGGAFSPNLHQLDYLAGVFATRQEFSRAMAGMPSYVTAYILLAR